MASLKNRSNEKKFKKNKLLFHIFQSVRFEDEVSAKFLNFFSNEKCRSDAEEHQKAELENQSIQNFIKSLKGDFKNTMEQLRKMNPSALKDKYLLCAVKFEASTNIENAKINLSLILNQGIKEKAMGAIARVEAATDPKKALDTLSKISNWDLKDLLIKKLVKNLVNKKMFSEALAAAEGIISLNNRKDLYNSLLGR